MKAAQSVRANFSGKSRVEILEKRECHVFPVVMITEGVHCGSAGCVYYPEDELSKFPAAWNHKPVVVRHPVTEEGDPQSACSPNVANTTKIGTLFNTILDGGKLKSEAWIYKDVCQGTFPSIWNALTNSQMQEVSTGLFFDTEEVSGVWNNETYVMVARNIRPDHLAILPDETGACSIEDGAGIPRVNKGEKKPVEKSNLLLRLNQDPSFAALTEAISGALADGPFHNDSYAFWIEDVFSNSVVYGDSSGSNRKYFQQGFTNTVDPIVVTLVGDPVEVQRSVQYLPLGTAVANVQTNTETTKMEKDPNEEPKPETAAEEAPAPKTAEEFVATAPTEEIKEELSEALSANKARKEALVTGILAKEGCPFTKEDLSPRSTKELEKLSALAATPKEAPAPVQGSEIPAANYGAAGGTVTAAQKVEPLVSPTMWEAK
jgi:hypothetical protein